MPHHHRLQRKRAFRAALALSGTTLGDWAAMQGVTRSHVHQVLAGIRDSERLTAEIDAFIAKWMPTHAAA